MAIADIDTVRLWCVEQEPPRGRPSRLEPLVTGRHIDLIVVRPAADAPERRTAVARLLYQQRTRSWILQWRDAEGAFHHYRSVPPTDRVRDLLDFLAGDPDPLFWDDVS